MLGKVYLRGIFARGNKVKSILAALGVVLVALRSLLGDLSSFLGRLGAVLSRSWAVLARSWGGLGPSWGKLIKIHVFQLDVFVNDGKRCKRWTLCGGSGGL